MGASRRLRDVSAFGPTRVMHKLEVWNAVFITAVSQRITFSGGCLGSSSDEERSEARYAWRCAEIRDLKVFECTAPCVHAQGTSSSASLCDRSMLANIETNSECTLQFSVATVTC